MNFMDAVCKVERHDVTLTDRRARTESSGFQDERHSSTADTTERRLCLVSVLRTYTMQKRSQQLTGQRSITFYQVKVYELLGAEVFLYFDVEGTQMTARVNPRTTLRTGDKAVFCA